MLNLLMNSGLTPKSNLISLKIFQVPEQLHTISPPKLITRSLKESHRNPLKKVSKKKKGPLKSSALKIANRAHYC